MGQTVADPASVLSSTTIARTLTVSDQHATLLLTVCDDVKGTESALLKLMLVPFHKTKLACLPHQADDNDDDDDADATRKASREKEEKEHSARIKQFLSQFDWRMTSESGAEYTYHEAFPKATVEEIVKDEELVDERDMKRFKVDDENIKKITNRIACVTFKAELVFPASERQVQRAMPSPGLAMVSETPELYQAVTKPYIDRAVGSNSLSWLQNIVQVKKEKERLLLNAEGWILNIDTKWRSHPDPFTVPRSEWFKHDSIVDLYCLGIIKQDGTASLRDLTAEHLPILRDMVERGPKVIETIYGVKQHQLRIFVHYQPQFYHFHVHFTRLENDTGAQAEKAHLLSDIIQDLEQDSDYFKKRTITFKLSLKDNLYKLIAAHQAEYAVGAMAP